LLENKNWFCIPDSYELAKHNGLTGIPEDDSIKPGFSQVFSDTQNYPTQTAMFIFKNEFFI